MDLWTDIRETDFATLDRIPRDFYDQHFYGPMFFIDVPNQGFTKILDGQQRIATTAIFLAATYDMLLFIERNRGAQFGARDYYGEIKGCLYQQGGGPRIVLGNRNRTFFEDITRPIQAREHPYDKIQSLVPSGAGRKSNALLLECYRFYVNSVLQHFAQATGTPLPRGAPDEQLMARLLANAQAEQFLTQMYDGMTRGMYVLRIPVDSADVVYEMFETLNQRGEKLFVSDLFKNLIFEKFSNRIPESRLEAMWNSLADVSDDDIDEYLRHFWLSKYDFVRKKKLFRAVRAKLEPMTVNDFNTFATELTQGRQIYNALANPDDPLWVNHQALSQLLDELDFLGFRQGMPLLLAAYEISPGNLDDLERLTRGLPEPMRQIIHNL